MSDYLNSFVLFGNEIHLRVALTLTHFLWQGAAIGAVVFAAAWTLRRSSASFRFVVDAVALACLPVCVAVTFVAVDVPGHWKTAEFAEPTSRVDSLPRDNEPIQPVTLPLVDSKADIEKLVPDDRDVGIPPSLAAHEPVDAVVEKAAAGVSDDRVSAAPIFFLRAAPVIAVVYFVGACLFLLRLIAATWGGHRLRCAANPIEDPRLLNLIATQSRKVGLRLVPTVALCERVAVPMVVGALRPIVLLPASIITGLDPQQFAAIISHEFAHIRRYDLLMNLMQRLVESLLFFHPVVWCISRRMSAEREACCDDLVVASGYDSMDYAGALLRMAELCSPANQTGVAVVAADGRNASQLELRIRRLMDSNRDSQLRLTRGGVFTIALLMICVAVTPVVLRKFAHAQEESGKPIARESTDKKPNKDDEPALPPRALFQIGSDRFRHRDYVNDMEYSPDGKTLATTASNSVNRGVRLWDAESGQLLKHLFDTNEQPAWNKCVAFSSDGSLIAAGDIRGRVSTWNVKTGKCLSTAEKHPHGAQCVAFLSNDLIVSAGADGSVRISKTRNLKDEIHKWSAIDEPPPEGNYSGSIGVNSIAVSSDGKRIAAGVGKKSQVFVWDVASRKLVTTIENVCGKSTSPSMRPELGSLYFSPDNRFVLTSGNRTVRRQETKVTHGSHNIRLLVVRVWDAQSGKLVKDCVEEQVVSFGATSIAHDGKSLASADGGAVRLWNIDTKKLIRKIDLPGVWGRLVRFSPDGKRLATATFHTVSFYDVESGRRVGHDGISRDTSVNCVAWSPTGSQVAIGYLDGVQLCGAKDGRVQHTFSMGKTLGAFSWTPHARGVVFTPDGKSVIAAGNEDDPIKHRSGVIRRWDTASGELQAEIAVPREVRAMALSHDGSRVVVSTSYGSWDDTQLFAYDVKSGEQVAMFPAARPLLTQHEALAFSPDGRHVHVACSNGSFFRWDTKENERDQDFFADWRTEDQRLANRPRLFMGSGVFTFDGQTLVTSNNDEIRWWETETGELLRVQKTPEAKGFRLGISPDGRFLVGSEINYASKTTTNKIQVWGAGMGQTLLTLEPKDARARGFAFSPDGSKLLTGFYRGTAIVWNLDDQKKAVDDARSNTQFLIDALEAASEDKEDEKPKPVPKPPTEEEARAAFKKGKIYVQIHSSKDAFFRAGADNEFMSLSFSGTKVTDEWMRYLLAFPETTSLRFSESTQITDKTLEIIGQLRNLKSLRLASSKITGSGLEQLANCSKLTSLTIKSRKLSDKELTQLEKLSKLGLVELTIGGWQSTDEGLQHVGNLKSLETLTLHVGQTPDGEALVTGKTLRALAPLTKLTSLEVMGDDIRLHAAVRDTDLAMLGYLPQLTSLNLSSRLLTDAAMKHIGQCKDLTQLTLWHMPITDEGLKHLAPLTKLRSMQLFGTKITGAGFKFLAEEGDLSRMSQLSLIGVSATDDGLAGIAKLPNVTSLRIGPKGWFDKDASGPLPVTDEGLAHLAELDGLSSLDLSMLQVTDAGLATLQDFAKLGELGLAKLPITDEGLANLSKLERLNSLSLRDCSKLTRKGVDRLHQSKPAIRVTVQVDGRQIGTLHHKFVKWDKLRTAPSNDN